MTEENVEHIPDTTGPPATETVASTRGDPHSAVGSVKTSLTMSGQAPIARPSFGNLQKVATQSNRSLSFQRLKEQQDAVVMPGNHAVDRTTVQFGQMGLGSGRPLDVDDEREDVETRTQPPQQSPSAPRAALPPTARAPQSLAEQAPAVALPSQPSGASTQSPQVPPAPGLTQTGSDPSAYEQYGRFGAAASYGQTQGAPPQKEYDPFSSQLNTAGTGESRSQYPGISQGPGAIANQASSYGSGYNQGGPGGYDSSFGGDQGRFSNYYGGYGGQQTATSMAENQAPQRSSSGFGEQSYGATAGAGNQSRFSEGPASGNNTPNPAGAAGQSHQSQQHMHSHNQSSYGGMHPYSQGGPYGYYGYGQQYPGQVCTNGDFETKIPLLTLLKQGFGNQYGYGQSGYGSGYGGKGGMYGHSQQHYGMSSHASGFEHSSSPANAGTLGGTSSLPRGESNISSNLNEYSRSGSTQPTTQTQSMASGGFGGASESYGRSSSGFGTHGQGYGQQSGTAEDSLKTMHEQKTGPSPALGSSNRPGSGFSGSAPSYGGPGGPQGSGGSGFPGHLNQLHNQYGGSGYGLGGLGGHHGGSGGHQQGGYGGYGGFGQGNGNYGGSGGGARGGWGSQYNNNNQSQYSGSH